MTVHFEPDTGRLRLDRLTFDALAAWASDRKADANRLDELRAAGVLRRRHPHPALVPALGAIADPVCRLKIEVHDREGGAEYGDGWVSGDAATLLLDSPDGLAELVVVHPTFLPAALARIGRLGPRPRLPTVEPLQASADQIERLIGPDPTARQAAADELTAPVSSETADAVRGLAAGLRQSWRVSAFWVAPQGAAGTRTLHVLDSDSGVWLVESGAGRSLIWPASPTAVWRALVALLPRDVELM